MVHSSPVIVDTARTYLPELWVVLIVLFLLYYAITDGFDLGVGIISLFTRSPEDRSEMILSLKGIWSGNQTWIVVLGGMLFGAFPIFYSILLSALYIPMAIMLFAFIFRGIGIDLGERYQYRPFWRYSFGIGSLAATLSQGFALGGLLSGINLKNGSFVGGVWDWLNPFALLITAGVLFGYTMLGGNFLVWKLEGRLAEKGRYFALVASVAAGIVSAGTWVKQYNLSPLLWNTAIILFSFLGLSLGFWPYMIPSLNEPITFRAAAASSPTLVFMFIVMVVLTPVILVYHNYQYWVFRGKTRGRG
ncbi:MAG: cytochrome d ubiquinol oxidase subunit II [Syntrophorhabdales bacterium]